jgi:hypothetical protein
MGWMRSQADCGVGFDVKQIIHEASRSLAHLDADRLEELALSCQALNQSPIREDFAEQARVGKEELRDLAVLGRVLEATRANISVMRQSHKSRKSRLEYSPEEGSALLQPETSNGNH